MQVKQSRVLSVKGENEVAVKKFAKYLIEIGIPKHNAHHIISNIDLFSEYLLITHKYKRGLLSIAPDDIFTFLSNWYPEKMCWYRFDSSDHIKSYATSFNHFSSWLLSRNIISKTQHQELKDVTQKIISSGNATIKKETVKIASIH